MTNNLKALIDNYKNISWPELKREKDLKHHLGELDDDFKFIRETLDFFVEDANIETFCQYSSSYDNVLQAALSEWLQIKEQILNHTNYQENPHIINCVRAYRYERMPQILQPIGPMVPMQKKQKETPAQLKRELKNIQKIRQQMEQELTNVKKTQSQSAGQAVGKAAQTFGTDFHKEAQKHEYWSYAMGVLFLLCITGVLMAGREWFIFEHDSALNFFDFIVKGNLLFKVFGVACFFSVLSLIKTEYMAHRHQMVVNRHRANAINSYKTLLSSVHKTDSESEKESTNAILVKLTDCLYGSPTTGFIKNANGNKGSNLQIVELARGALRSKS